MWLHQRVAEKLRKGRTLVLVFFADEVYQLGYFLILRSGKLLDPQRICTPHVTHIWGQGAHFGQNHATLKDGRGFVSRLELVTDFFIFGRFWVYVVFLVVKHGDGLVFIQIVDGLLDKV